MSENRFVEEKTKNDLSERMTRGIVSNQIELRNAYITKEIDD
jgi:hypothetical protein